MIEGGQHHIVTNEGIIPDVNAALVLEFTAHVDKNPFSDVDVFAAVGVKGREQSEGFVHRLSDELREQGPQLFRFMVPAVEFRRDAQRLLTGGVHEQMGFAAAGHGRAAVQMIQKCV